MEIDKLEYTFLVFQEEFVNQFLSDKYFMYRLLYCYQHDYPTWFDLTEEEEHAIFYHDGAYGSLAYDLKGHEEPLQVIVHFADFWSAQFLEVGKLDRFNDQVKPEETTDEVKDCVSGF